MRKSEDLTYTERLANIGITLLEPYRGAKAAHTMKCAVCNHAWTATPVAKMQAYTKRRTNGCPNCYNQQDQDAKLLTRQHNVKALETRGFEILSDWDGRNATGAKSVPTPVTVRQTKCGHVFTSTAVNLLRTDMKCSVCGIQHRTGNINHWSELNSAKWRQTAPAWKVYRAEVTKLTRLTYRKHSATINPNNLPTGRAGTEGAYHLDHIVPVRWCFVRDVPPEIVADVTNLEMIPWRDNIVHRDNLKGDLPLLFHPYNSVAT